MLKLRPLVLVEFKSVARQHAHAWVTSRQEEPGEKQTTHCVNFLRQLGVFVMPQR